MCTSLASFVRKNPRIVSLICAYCSSVGELLYNIGAFSVMDLVENGEWHRIFTSMFLHADIEHLISNMLVLYYIGNVIEKQPVNNPPICAALLTK